MISAPQMGDVMSSYNGGMGSGPQGAGGIPRNNARVRPTLRKYESVGAMKPPLRDTKMQSTESAPSPDLESQEKVFKSRQGSFRRTFSLKSEKFLRRLQRGSSSSSSKLSLSESVGEEGSFEGAEKKPKGLMRVGTMPVMRLGGRRNTRDSDISEDSLSFRSDTDGSLWNVVKSRIGSFNFSRTNSQGSQSSIEALSPPIHHGDADEQVDAVYQVLKQGAMLRASERTEEDPILARRQASLSAQNSLEVTENGSATQQSETTTATTNHVEASSSVTTTTSSSSSSTTKSMKVTSSSSSVVSKPPISNSKSKGSSSSSKTENYTIEYKQETAVGAAAVTTEKKKGSFSSSGGGQQKQDFGDVVFKVMSGGGD